MACAVGSGKPWFGSFIAAFTSVKGPQIDAQFLNLNQKDKMDVKIRVMRRLTESHIDALYEAMEERMLERLEASELNKNNEEQQE